MKKLFTIALAAATLAGFNACTSEDDNVDATKGYINVGVTIDDAPLTRATQNADAATWYAVVTNGDGDPVFGTLATKALIGTTLGTTPLAAGGYNVAVSNFADNDDWLTANNGFGAAYYEGEASGQTVTAGQTTNVAIECGKAQNAKFSILSSGFSGTALSVDVTAPRALTFSTSASTISNDAFFAAGAELTYTITYTINGITKTSAAKTFTLGAAGSASALTIKSNANGTISVSITYDDDYSNGSADEVEIDAATGEEV